MSDNVDSLPKHSDLSNVEQNAFEMAGCPNRHTLARETVDKSKGRYSGTNNSFVESMGQIHPQSVGPCTEVPIAMVTQCDSSTISPVISGGPCLTSAKMPLGSPADVVNFSNMKTGSASSLNSPESERPIELSDEAARVIDVSSDRRNNAGLDPAARMEIARKVAADLIQALSTNRGSAKEIESILHRSVTALSHDNGKTTGTRKRNYEDTSSAETSDTKRKRVACEFCPKTMVRRCDLKSVPLFSQARLD